MNYLLNKKILLLGGTGLAGSSIKEELKINNIFFDSPSRQEVNLFNKSELDNYLSNKKYDIVINAAAKVGGIYNNIKNPLEFYYENSLIQDNVLYSAIKNNIKNMVFLSSSCIYPEHGDFIPSFEEVNMSYDNLHKTNLGYTLAKKNYIDVLKMANEKYGINFLYLIICNLFGEKDNYSDESSHFLPIIIKKIHYAKTTNQKELHLQCNNEVFREFFYIKDFAYNFIKLLNVFNIKKDFLNFGSGIEYNLYDLLFLLKDIIGYKGEIIISEPVTIGNKRRLMNIDRLKTYLEKMQITDIRKSLENTYKNFIDTAT